MDTTEVFKCLARKLEVRQATNRNWFVTGEVTAEGKTTNICVWDQKFIDLVKEEKIVAGSLLEASWVIKDFKGNTQYDLNNLVSYTHRDKLSEEQACMFTRGPAVSRDQLLQFYNDEVLPLMTITQLQDVIEIMAWSDPNFWKAPAAKGHHHNWRGGLSEHVYNLLSMYVQLVKSKHPYISKLNHSLVVFGIVLHDWGKTKDYTQPMPGVFEYSKFLSLVGHLAGSALEVTAVLKTKEIAVSEELYMHMMHVLLAHHGQLDWGSPVTPVSPEAIMVHYLDNLDGKLFMATETEAGSYCKGLSGNVYRFVSEG